MARECIRMCVVCRAHKNKSELIRIVHSNDGFIVDKTGKINARGFYICNEQDCINKIEKNKFLNRIFHKNFDNEVYSKLLKEIQ